MIETAYVFRYRCCNQNNFNSLVNDYIWFSSISILNDPFDGSVAYEWDRKEDHLIFQEISNRIPQLLKYGKKFLQRTMDLSDPYYTLKEPILISCFSRSFDNILMWSHYAQGHTGFCEVFKCTEVKENIFGIEINIESINKNAEKIIIDNQYLPIFPVEYNNKKTEPVLSSETNSVVGSEKRFKSYFQKAEDWKYEKEHRAILYEDSLIENNKLYYPNGSLVSVIMGSEISVDDYNKLIKICKNKKISLSKMKKVYNDYRLVPEKIL